MKVFISWSGEFSHEIAIELNLWIKCVLQLCKPWISSEDIEKGKIWFDEISDALSETNIGILVLTKENKDKPWILFEAGALSKGLNKNKVCPILVDLAPTDITAPLSEFNCTNLENREDMMKFFGTLNKELKENKLEEPVFSRVFEKYWEDFLKKIKEIKQKFKKEDSEKTEKKKEDSLVTIDMMNEFMYEVRSIRRTIEKNEKGMMFSKRRMDLREKISKIFSLEEKRYISEMVYINEIEKAYKQLIIRGFTEIEALDVIRDMKLKRKGIFLDQ